jgi:rubrerythrin
VSPITATPLLRRRRQRPARDTRRRRLTSADARARRAADPQDRALYHCQCGYHWQGEVTTSVGCPHCGTAQAW